LAAGTYILRETTAPAGYVLADDVVFTVTNEQGAEVVTVEMEDAPTEIQVTKTDSETGNALEGATLQILEANADGTAKLDANDEEILAATIYEPDTGLEWKTDGTVKTIKGLAAGNYILREKEAPDGYTVAADVPFTVTNEQNAEVISLEMEDAPTEIQVTKTDSETEEPLAGATLQILITDDEGNAAADANGNVIVAETIYGETLEWVTDGTVKTILGLATGTYILREKDAPSGYDLAEDQVFEVTDTLDKVVSLSMADAPNEIYILKVDSETNAYVEGARFELQDESGDVVKNIYGDKLVFTTGDVVTLTGVETGTYTLVETYAPTGYAYSADLTLTIADVTDETTGITDTEITLTIDGASVETTTVTDEETGTEYQVFVIEDAPIHLLVDKIDLTTQKEVAGATLTLYDSDTREVIAEWVSKEGETFDFGSYVEAGKSYLLVETVAPAGYAYTSSITFNIGLDGTISTSASTTVDEKGNVVYLVEDAPTEAEISKTDLATDKELEGAELQILDENGKVAVTIYGETLSWTSGTTPKTISGLAAGTYTLHEVKAPDGYALADDITFTVGTDGTTTKVTMEDDKTKVYISKVDADSQEEISGAHLALKDSSGETIMEWTTTGETKEIEGQLVGGETYT
ncbi:MAG: hypothetical protein LIO94_11375, partial [Clostridiales bacterium]|nr:hypothetical protein [Clostridiales bacterium]